MTEPTKGPWKEHYIPSYSSHIVGADGKTVADCFDERDWDSNKCTYAEGECQANIDLIAACARPAGCAGKPTVRGVGMGRFGAI